MRVIGDVIDCAGVGVKCNMCVLITNKTKSLQIMSTDKDYERVVGWVYILDGCLHFDAAWWGNDRDVDVELELFDIDSFVEHLRKVKEHIPLKG